MSGNAAQSSKVAPAGAKSRYEKYMTPCETKSTADQVPNISDLVLENIGKGNVVPAGDKGGKRLLFKYKDPVTNKVQPRVLFKLRCQLAGTFWYNDGTKVYTKTEDKKDAPKGKGKANVKTEETQEEKPSGKKSYSIAVDSFVDAIPEDLTEEEKKSMMTVFEQLTQQQCGITSDHADVVDSLKALYDRAAVLVEDVINDDDETFVSAFMPDRPWAAMPHFLKYPTDGKIKGAPNLEKLPTGWKIKIPHFDNGSTKRANIFDLNGQPIKSWGILGGCRVLFDAVLSLENVFSNGQTAYIQLVATELTILNSEKRSYEPLNKRAISLATDETKGVQKAKLEELKRMAEERRNKAMASKDEKKLEEEANAALGITSTKTGAKLKVAPKTETEEPQEEVHEEQPGEELGEEPEEVPEDPPVKPPAKVTPAKTSAAKAPPKAPAKGPAAKKSANFTRAEPV